MAIVSPRRPPAAGAPPVMSVIRARDGSREAIAKALTERDARMRPGVLGAGCYDVVLVPSVPGRVATQAERVQHQRRVDAYRATPSVPAAVAAIRAHSRTIAGYAAVFDQPNTHGEVIRRGAFEDIENREVFLLLDHREGRASLASTRAGTLHVAEDAVGLWFEAALGADREGVDTMRAVRFGSISGVSWGAVGTMVDRKDGDLTAFTRLPTWELSLLLPPTRPRFPQAWVAPSAEALRRRAVQHKGSR